MNGSKFNAANSTAFIFSYHSWTLSISRGQPDLKPFHRNRTLKLITVKSVWLLSPFTLG
jgi:hypothetical protein